MCNRKHCIRGCIHYIIREIPGTKHDCGLYCMVDPPKKVHDCELYPERYRSWMEEFGQIPQSMLTDEDYKVFDQCYEPNEFTAGLDKMINLAQDILDNIDKKDK